MAKIRLSDEKAQVRMLKGYEVELYKDEMFSVGMPDTEGNEYVSIKDGVLKCKKGYAWDGSSVPFKKILRVLSFGLYKADRYSMMASLAHDALYQLFREKHSSVLWREDADWLYYDLCIEGGMSRRQANWRLEAVRKFAEKSSRARKNPRGKVVEI